MSERRKKPAVIPELRKNWLIRYEVEGESPPHIAETDGYDVRTVRKQIELAKQEREIKEARATVLRQALERHYADLCTFAEKVDAELVWPPRKISTTLKDDRMWRALKEHLPKSPIWRTVRNIDQLVEQYESCVEHIKERVQLESEKQGFKFANPGERAGVADGFNKDIVVNDVVSLARGHKRLKDVATFSQKEFGDTSLLDIRYGAYGMGLLPAEEASRLEEFYFRLLDEVVEWDESIRLREVVMELERQLSILREELATIVLRGIVSGAADIAQYSHFQKDNKCKSPYWNKPKWKGVKKQ